MADIINSIYNSGWNGFFNNAKFVDVTNLSLSAGENDLYTVPTGKRALVPYVLSTYNNSGSTCTYQAKIKVGGTRYIISSAVGIGNNSGSTMNYRSLVLEAGESLCMSSSNAGSCALGWVIEFDDNSPMKSFKNFNVVNGNVTLYTCPSGKTAKMFNLVETAAAAGSAAATINPTATGVNLTMYLVPSGQSVGVNYQNQQATGIFALADSVDAPIGGIMAAGDFIAANNPNASNQLYVWGIVIEQ